MSPFLVFATALVLALLATSLVFGVGIVAVPVAVVALAIGFLLDLRRRRTQARLLHTHRERANETKVDFTPRDRETLVSDGPRSSGGG
jgi:uncharacterized membrane protein